MLRHRGPNESGTFVAGPALLGNTRLSIIDLAGGSQPISNEDGSIVVVYNGEIWNYRALRDELAGLGHVFATKSDTEVLVHGFEEWGEGRSSTSTGCSPSPCGTPAASASSSHATDSGRSPCTFGCRLGSRLRVGCAVGIPRLGTRPEIAREHVGEYLFQRYVVSPRTLFAGVDRLAPAHAATYDRHDAACVEVLGRRSASSRRGRSRARNCSGCSKLRPSKGS